MFLKKTMLAPVGVLVLGVTAFGSNGVPTHSGSPTELTLRVPNETAPAGGIVQMKVMTTEVTPISGGRPGFSFDGGAAAGFSIAAPNGEVAGAAVLDGPHVQIFYSGTSLLTANYPILTVALRIPDDAPAGRRTQFAIDASSIWNFSTTGPMVAKPVSPATITVAGSGGISITDVVPGEGVWPAGTVVSVRGVGFSSRTSLRVNDAGARNVIVVSPAEIQFTLTQPTEIRGLKITAQDKINSSTYYAYMRGITAAVSSRVLLATTEPIFAVVPRTVATFGPVPALAGNQYAALALQNPTAAAVTVSVALYAADGTPIHQATLTLESRHRLAMEVSELLDGVAPPAGASVVVTASSPIDAIGLLCDEGRGEIAPALPLEARR